MTTTIHAASQPTALLLADLFAAGKMTRSAPLIAQFVELHSQYGYTGCYVIHPAMILDLRDAGYNGWTVLEGTSNGWTAGPRHRACWIENGSIAIDASPIVDGASLVVVAPATDYRAQCAAVPDRAYRAPPRLDPYRGTTVTDALRYLTNKKSDKIDECNSRSST